MMKIESGSLKIERALKNDIYSGVRKSSVKYFVFKVCFLLAVWSISVILVLIGNLISQVLGVLLLGVMFAHAVELQHELIHMSDGSEGFKRILGFVLGLPMLVSFSHYKYTHMQHHKLVGTEDDTEFFSYGNKDLNIYSFIKCLFMPGQYAITLSNIAKSFGVKSLAGAPAKIERKIKLEYMFIGMALLIAISVSLMTMSPVILKVWLVPLVFVASPIHVLVEIPEHAGCEKDNRDIFFNTRTINAGRIISWLVNGNNFHVEHHYFPTVPIHNLRKLNKIIGDNSQFKSQSYLEFYKEFVKDFFGKNN